MVFLLRRHHRHRHHLDGIIDYAIDLLLSVVGHISHPDQLHGSSEASNRLDILSLPFPRLFGCYVGIQYQHGPTNTQKVDLRVVLSYWSVPLSNKGSRTVG